MSIVQNVVKTLSSENDTDGTKRSVQMIIREIIKEKRVKCSKYLSGIGIGRFGEGGTYGIGAKQAAEADTAVIFTGTCTPLVQKRRIMGSAHHSPPSPREYVRHIRVSCRESSPRYCPQPAAPHSPSLRQDIRPIGSQPMHRRRMLPARGQGDPACWQHRGRRPEGFPARPGPLD